MAASAAVSEIPFTGCPRQQLVIASQGGRGPVVAGQRADRDDRRNRAAGQPASVDEYCLRVEGTGAGCPAHRFGQGGRGQGAVAEQHLDQRPGPGRVTAGAAGGVPLPLMAGG